jgi:hypothetical protein
VEEEDLTASFDMHNDRGGSSSSFDQHNDGGRGGSSSFDLCNARGGSPSVDQHNGRGEYSSFDRHNFDAMLHALEASKEAIPHFSAIQ